MSANLQKYLMMLTLASVVFSARLMLAKCNMEMFKVIIYWTNKSTPDIIRNAKCKYNISGGLTVNHTMECEVSSDVLCALQKAQELGYIQIRKIEKIEITKNR